jgi:hypothetical protein
MKAALLALLLSQAPLPDAGAPGRPALIGAVGESVLHFKARILVRACSFTEMESVIDLTMDALGKCGEDDSPCEFLICNQLGKTTNRTCARLGATPL